MTPSRLIVGLILTITGVLLLAIPLALSFALFPIGIYGLIALVLGIIILLNNKEDKIEQIKRREK